MGSITPGLMLVIGIIIGWVLAWLAGRSGREGFSRQIERMQSDLQRTNGLLEESRAQARALNEDLANCEAQLAEAGSNLADVQQGTMTTLDSGPTRASAVIDLGAQVHVDDFTQIKGIGPGYAARLAEAGITSYADL
ncbi:MAG: hypothetical protein KDE47_29950, partial [Caldilineaceae bacterium]|nr:hypothetical protein [Caldilineaceae bacterium]